MCPDYKPEIEFTIAEINKIYYTLSEYDRFIIDDLVRQLQDSVMGGQETRATVYFGRFSALELLMKLGIWMIEKGYENDSH